MSPTVSDHDNDSGRHVLEERPDALELLQQLLAELREADAHLAAMRAGAGIDSCLLDKIGRITVSWRTRRIRTASCSKVDRRVDGRASGDVPRRASRPGPAARPAGQARGRSAALLSARAAPADADLPVRAVRAVRRHPPRRWLLGQVARLRPSAAGGPQTHEPWPIEPHTLHENEVLPAGPARPARRAVRAVGGDAARRSTSAAAAGAPRRAAPGARHVPNLHGERRRDRHLAAGHERREGGDVVVMSGNLWLKLSVDGGKTFTDVDFTKVFAADKTYGGWAGDQVIHYVPQIDCFVLYVQSSVGAKGTANAEQERRQGRARQPGRPEEVQGRQGGLAAPVGLHVRRLRAQRLDGLPRPQLRRRLPLPQHQRVHAHVRQRGQGEGRVRRQAVLRAAAEGAAGRHRLQLLVRAADRRAQSTDRRPRTSATRTTGPRTSTTRRCASTRPRGTIRTTTGASATSKRTGRWRRTTRTGSATSSARRPTRATG